MPVTILVGAQWGDEGKGRFVDWYARDAAVCARYAGGDNAGHTVAVGDKVYKLHLIPSGVLHPGVMSILGNGMVINPVNLLAEMDRLAVLGLTITPDNLMISSRAHMITPAHVERDRAIENSLGDHAIGTTLRGIGPAYLDKVGRLGIRVGEMLDVEAFGERLMDALVEANKQVVSQGYPSMNVAELVRDYIQTAIRLRPFIGDTSVYINTRLREGAHIVCEGAQGTLLDVDHGSYPFVTSSSPTAGGALTGLGFGPTHVTRVIGVAKAFSTRVGGGAMPTELDGDAAVRLRGTGANFWDEFGTTTGRPRRTGWLDGVMLRYAVQVNGCTELALTKLDVLSGLTELKIARQYRINDVIVDYPPSTARELDEAEPIYDSLPGWHADITAARRADDLPEAVMQYIRHIESIAGIPVTMASVGPERDELVVLS